MSIIFKHGKLYCSFCGDSQEVPKPVSNTVYNAMKEAFEEMHSDCHKTYRSSTEDREKVEKAMQKQKLNRSQTAKMAGIYPHHLSNWLNGRIQNLQERTKQKIFKALNIK